MLVFIERVQAISPEEVKGALQVQQLAEGVVSVEWTRRDMPELTPRVHLHVGDGSKPPVDLTFAEHDGRLIGVQVVLQDEVVREQHVLGDWIAAEPGLPVADLTPWRGEEQILDHAFTPTIGWEPAGTLTVRIARTETRPAKECAVDGLRLVLDSRGLVLGIRLAEFSELDLAAIARAAGA